MAKGGRIYCDDAFSPTCKGATIAMEEYCNKLDKPILIDSTYHTKFKHVFVQF